ncbi:MAG: bifunctional phosphoribosyl-AMP cyclohydrolase/phosphoribosyl-ATP diphosphatase HisIE [Lachnospiraceae bacterium]|nr:bifunctional phosphoribosyl-AMP cyclohydrolase/phosphoribosyl-ATP diphosphatase HisIE [Lachnospiraceae bacterium]
MKGGIVVKGLEDETADEESDLISHLTGFENAGCDGAIIIDLSEEDKDKDKTIKVLKNANRSLNIPVFAGGRVKCFEDAKKLLYAGCAKVIVNIDDEDNFKGLKEASKRFGKDKILGFTENVHIASGQYNMLCGHEIDDLVGTFLFEPKDSVIPARVLLKDGKLPVIPIIPNEDLEKALFDIEAVVGVTGDAVADLGGDIYEFKIKIKDKYGFDVNIFESSMDWSELKKNEIGLVPVIVQDHKTDEVLMLAYMNEESFKLTLKSGKMTYWSRSRNSLWIKGETSGCFQYVKSLSIDCDNDTILAKVIQIGAACHTGNKSCFYRDMVNDNEPSTNPYKVFEDVYAVIKDRKKHPKEGSYTNYLFDKGIDKILKKVGEEATEIVIAAKNPDAEEIKYEVADFLYHIMVLMVERGVTWEDITEELSKR